MTDAAAALQRASDVVELTELMARYTRAVDSLRFEQLTDLFAPDAFVRYRWLPLGADAHRSVDLHGVVAIEAWLQRSLDGRTELRRYLSGFELLSWAGDAAVASVQMHERGMRITGRYRFGARRGPAGWRLEDLRLTEQIHWA